MKFLGIATLLVIGAIATLMMIGAAVGPRQATSASPTAPAPIASLTGHLNPTTLRVGMQQTFSFDISNDGAVDIDGIEMHCSCPWDKYTIVGMSPRGMVGDSLGTKTFKWSEKLLPGETRTFQITASPNVAGNYDFSFRLWDGQHGQLKNGSGHEQIVGTKIAVTS